MRRPAPLALALLAVGCAHFDPLPLDQVGFHERIQSQTLKGVRVEVAVLTERETRRAFSVPMERKGIQPVWLRIHNGADRDLVFLSASLDPAYFSAHEVSWMNHFFLGGRENEKMDSYLHANEIDLPVDAGATLEGFLYTNRDRGVKFVSVDLLGDNELLEFGFVVEIPGFRADYQQVDFDHLYAPDRIRQVDLEELRGELEALPCCVAGGDGKTPGDPLNLVVVGDPESVLVPFLRRGWSVTERLHAGSLWGTIRSSLFRSEYKNSPISPLYLYGRPQDLGLQKARGTVDERNHLRLWLSPIRYRDQEVWVGQVSRDIGVRLSRRTLVTHEIDPDVDEARDYVVQDLILSNHLEALAFVAGVGAAPQQEPRYNYTLSTYFTDGLRAVLFTSEGSMAPNDVDYYDWE